MYGFDGNDSLTGSSYDDVIDGGTGNDKIYGGSNSGDDTIIGGAGDDKLYGGTSSTSGSGSNTYRFSKGDGKDVIYEYKAEDTDTIEFTDVASDELRSVERNGYHLVLKYGDSDQITVSNYFKSSIYQIEQIRFSDGMTLDSIFIGTAASDALSGTAENDWIDAGTGADSLTGGLGNDIYVIDHADDVIIEGSDAGWDEALSSVSYSLAANIEALRLMGGDAISATGNAAANLLVGNTAANTLNGGEGADVLQGGAGADLLVDIAGNNLLDGGSGDDVLQGGTENNLFVGGKGDDVIEAGGSQDVIFFNQNDGCDTVISAAAGEGTLSLGEGITYADLLFSKSGDDLILSTGTTDQITFKNWYGSAPSRGIANLQMVIEGSADYDPSSGDAMRDNAVEQFDFAGLAAKFDEARAMTPTLNQWALSSALAEFHLAGSDIAAIGGDLGYEYGRNGSFSNISASQAQALLSSPQFGIEKQEITRASGSGVSPGL